MTSAESVAAAVFDADLVVLAMPLPALGSALAELAGSLRADAVLTDVGTLKQPVFDAVAAAGPAARFVGGHPLAGTEDSGWAAGSAGLFRDAPWALSLTDDTDLDAWLGLAAVLCELGAHPVPACPRDQDAAVARVIGLPHVLAEALALTGLDGGPLGLSLAAGSYTSGSRVARTRPELVATWCDGNLALVHASGRGAGPPQRHPRRAGRRRFGARPGPRRVRGPDELGAPRRPAGGRRRRARRAAAARPGRWLDHRGARIRGRRAPARHACRCIERHRRHAASVPLVEVVRSGLVEGVHRGHVVVLGPDGAVHDRARRRRRADVPALVQQAAAGGRPARAGLHRRASEQLALAAASHSGEPLPHRRRPLDPGRRRGGRGRAALPARPADGRDRAAGRPGRRRRAAARSS